MTGLLSREIKQGKPFASLELEAFLNLCRTADAVQRPPGAVLKALGLTGAQYNVLRILNGAGPAGLSCSELSVRMVTYDPDVTRLLDKLEARGLVQRQRIDSDRRMVITSLTAAGSALAENPDLNQALLDCHRHQFAPLSPEQLRLLIDLLERLRQPVASDLDPPSKE